MERLKKKICYIFYWKGSKVVKILLFKNDEKPGKKPYPKYIIAESTKPWSFCQTLAINEDLSTFTFRMINKGAFFPQTIAYVYVYGNLE